MFLEDQCSPTDLSSIFRNGAHIAKIQRGQIWGERIDKLGHEQLFRGFLSHRKME